MSFTCPVVSPTTECLDPILQAFYLSNTTISNFIILLLKDNSLHGHAGTKDLVANSQHILDAFLSHPKTSKSTWDWANATMQQNYAADIQNLADKDNGWHFGALHASESKLRDFQIESTAKRMQWLALELLDMLGLMLSANRHETQHMSSADGDLDDSMKNTGGSGEEDEEYWDDLEGVYIEEQEGTFPKVHDLQRTVVIDN